VPTSIVLRPGRGQRKRSIATHVRAHRNVFMNQGHLDRRARVQCNLGSSSALESYAAHVDRRRIARERAQQGRCSASGRAFADGSLGFAISFAAFRLAEYSSTFTFYSSMFGPYVCQARRWPGRIWRCGSSFNVAVKTPMSGHRPATEGKLMTSRYTRLGIQEFLHSYAIGFADIPTRRRGSHALYSDWKYVGWSCACSTSRSRS